MTIRRNIKKKLCKLGNNGIFLTSILIMFLTVLMLTGDY
jgi:hypothetical protein